MVKIFFWESLTWFYLRVTYHNWFQFLSSFIECSLWFSDERPYPFSFFSHICSQVLSDGRNVMRAGTSQKQKVSLERPWWRRLNHAYASRSFWDSRLHSGLCESANISPYSTSMFFRPPNAYMMARSLLFHADRRQQAEESISFKPSPASFCTDDIHVWVCGEPRYPLWWLTVPTNPEDIKTRSECPAHLADRHQMADFLFRSRTDINGLPACQAMSCKFALNGIHQRAIFSSIMHSAVIKALPDAKISIYCDCSKNGRDCSKMISFNGCFRRSLLSP